MQSVDLSFSTHIHVYIKSPWCTSSLPASAMAGAVLALPSLLSFFYFYFCCFNTIPTHADAHAAELNLHHQNSSDAHITTIIVNNGLSATSRIIGWNSWNCPIEEKLMKLAIAETVDIDMKRWSAGKEGNLRALLTTLQHIVWPKCGWQPIGLTDLITAAQVKKWYRKAVLCVHPDKVAQKGATFQQRYISEKVFDLLKDAWNKFQSEELF